MPPESDGGVLASELPRISRSKLAGIGALAAGVAWLAWATVNTRTHGGLDAGASVVGEQVARAGALLMVAWNVLLLPAALEVSYIALSALWWAGIGVTILSARRAFGVFTIVVALFAGWDALLTAWEPVPFGLYMTAAPKLPLSIIWDFWLALVLLRPSPD